MTVVGTLAKMPTQVNEQGDVHYHLPLGQQRCYLNPLIGKQLSLRFTGKIACVYCGASIKKAYQQGYCYLATQKLAQCDLCILKPELCHFHKNTCREPEWGEAHCMQTHYVYLANASALKVGITRAKNIPSRWVDQGAVQALPILKVASRRISGLVEIEMAKTLADKTNWRKMLKNEVESLDLQSHRDAILKEMAEPLAALSEQFGPDSIKVVNETAREFHYPVRAYPSHIKSFNFDKNPLVEGTLMGIKGQYLILDTGVINVRKFSGYDVEVKSDATIEVTGVSSHDHTQHCPFST